MDSPLAQLARQSWHRRQVPGPYPEPVLWYWWCQWPTADRYRLVLKAERRVDEQALVRLFDEIATQLWRELCWCRQWQPTQPFDWYQMRLSRGRIPARLEQVGLRWRGVAWEEYHRQAMPANAEPSTQPQGG